MNKKLTIYRIMTLLIAVTSVVACEENESTNQLFEKPVFGAMSTSTDILYEQNITFTDTSTQVYARQWSFPGANPASSTDSVVTVSYPSGGDYEATLVVTHIDNQQYQKKFFVSVEGPTVQTFGFYSEAPNVSFGQALTFEPNNGFNISTTTTDKFEGEKSIEFKFKKEDTWGVQGSLKPAEVDKVDISEYAGGTYKVAIKTSCDLPMLIRLHTNNGAEQRAIIKLDPVEETYGLKRDGEWHQLEIPMQDFIDANDQIDLTAVTHLLVLRSDTPDVKSTEDWDWYIDNFYLELRIEPGD